MESNEDKIPCCSFCGKTAEEVQQLITADKTNETCICNECVGLCNEILEEELWKKYTALETKYNSLRDKHNALIAKHARAMEKYIEFLEKREGA